MANEARVIQKQLVEAEMGKTGDGGTAQQQ
jgi:hypothetical protein